MLPTRAPPPKRYILIHDSRRGLAVHAFESKKDLSSVLNKVTVHEDLTTLQQDLLRFLLITVEWNDHIIIKPAPESEGEFK